MSLSSQLRDGSLHAFFTANAPGTQQLAAQVADLQRDRSRIGPVDRTAGMQHLADVGGAFGQRLAFLVQPAPPYYALLGTNSAGLASGGCVDRGHRAFATHAALPADGRALWRRPLPRGCWLDLPGDPVALDPLDRTEQVLHNFIDRTAGYLASHAPPGTLGRPGVEAGLARCCWPLAGFEDAYRGGALADDLAALYNNHAPTVDELHAHAPQHVVDELVQLAGRLHTSGALAELHSLAGNPPPGHPLGTAAPVLVPNWADGDLVVGDTLIDVKTVMTLRNAERTGRWFWQLLAYAWLDVSNRWKIRRVGLYLARHGALITWPLPAFAATLLGGAEHVGPAWKQFLALTQDAVRNDGGDPTWITQQLGT